VSVVVANEDSRLCCHVEWSPRYGMIHKYLQCTQKLAKVSFICHTRPETEK